MLQQEGKQSSGGGLWPKLGTRAIPE